MNSDDFVGAVVRAAYQSTITGVAEILESPPGRSPRPDLIALSDWRKSLDDSDAANVQRVIRLAADHAVFGVLAILDGVRSIDDAHSEVAVRVGTTEVSAHHDLHEIFRFLVDETESLTRDVRTQRAPAPYSDAGE